MSDSEGPARGYSWPSFEAGHERSTVTGARSERHVGPLAEQILAAELAKPACPLHLRDRGGPFASAMTEWARAQAISDLLFGYLAEQDLPAALEEVSREAGEEERPARGTVRRRSVAKRTASTFDAWLKASKHAAALRKSLGLDPESAARVSRDLSLSRSYQVRSPLDKALDRIAEQRAIGGADDDRQ